MDDENNRIDATQHNLRPRDTLQAPSRYASQEQLQNQASVTKIKLLKRKRAGKKGLITKKINQIKKLINERRSRTKIQFLHASLMDCKRETTEALVGEYLRESITNDNPGESLSDLEKQMNNLSINKNVNKRSELSPHAVSFENQKGQSHETNPKLVFDKKTTENFRIPNETKIHPSIPSISK